MGLPKMVITVPDKGRQTYQISRLPLIIGSGERCHVQITASKEVAEQHVRIFREEGDDRLICEDLQSGSPVVVNGEPIGEHVIQDGELIVLGDTTLQFFYPLEENVDGDLEFSIFAGPGAGKRIPVVEGKKVTIGRHSANTISVPKPNVSGKHAVITALEFSQVVVTDLDSRNGTRVNGVQIAPKKAVPLNPGDIIDIGPVSVMLVPAGGGPKVQRQRTTASPPKTPVSRTRVDHDRDRIVAAAQLASSSEVEDDPREFIAPPSMGFTKAAAEAGAPASSAGSTRRAKAVSPNQLPDSAAGGTKKRERRPPSRPPSTPRPTPTATPPLPDVSSQQRMRALRGGQEQAAAKPMYEATLDLDSPENPGLSEHYDMSRSGMSPDMVDRQKGIEAASADDPLEDSLIDVNDLERAMDPGDETAVLPPDHGAQPPPPPPPPPLPPGQESEAPVPNWGAPADHSAPTMIDDNIYADDLPGTGGPPPPAGGAHSAPTMIDDNVYEDDAQATPAGGPPPPPPPPFGAGAGGGAHSAPTMIDDNVYEDDQAGPGVPPPPPPPPGAGMPPQPQPGSPDYLPHSGPVEEFDLNDLAAGANFRPGQGPSPVPGGGGGGDRRPPMQPHVGGNSAPMSSDSWRPTNGPLPPELEHYRGQIPEVARLVGPALITLPAIPDESGEGADAHLTVQASVQITGRLVMGRRRTNGLRLPHGECSGEHTAVEIQNGQVMVMDLGSLNGTFVNGNRIDGPRALQRFDEVVLGPYRFLYVPTGESFPG